MPTFEEIRFRTATMGIDQTVPVMHDLLSIVQNIMLGVATITFHEEVEKKLWKIQGFENKLTLLLQYENRDDNANISSQQDILGLDPELEPKQGDNNRCTNTTTHLMNPIIVGNQVDVQTTRNEGDDHRRSQNADPPVAGGAPHFHSQRRKNQETICRVVQHTDRNDKTNLMPDHFENMADDVCTANNNSTLIKTEGIGVLDQCEEEMYSIASANPLGIKECQVMLRSIAAPVLKEHNSSSADGNEAKEMPSNDATIAAKGTQDISNSINLFAYQNRFRQPTMFQHQVPIGIPKDRVNCFKDHTRSHPCDESKLLKCPLCEKWFRSKSSLIEHMDSAHSKKRYSCTQCHKQFKRKQGLKFHEKRHAGDLPYQCVHCLLKFVNFSSLTTHQKRAKHI